MDRMACVDLAEFPLQLLLGRHPEWREHPTVVLDRDRPQGKILWANRAARQHRIQAGMRHAEALALARNLNASEVSPSQIEKSISWVCTRLRHFSPKVQPSQEQPGVFWIDASGLSRLYDSLETWGEAIRSDLAKRGLESAIVVGFTQFGTHALARSMPRSVFVLRDLEQERQAAGEVPLDVMTLALEEHVLLNRLGIRTLRSLLSLPERSLRKRFSPETVRLHRWGNEDLWTPFEARPPEEVHRESLFLDEAETDLHRLLFRTKQMLGRLLAPLVKRGEGLVWLEMRLVLEQRTLPHQGGKQTLCERIRTAAPTREIRQILNLVHLRLESLELRSGVVEIEVEMGTIRMESEQLGLFEETRTRDLSAGDRALARLRAEFGEEVVVRASLVDRHLPEAQFRWERLERLVRPRPGSDARRHLVRRLLHRPRRLSAPASRRLTGWTPFGSRGGRVIRHDGPYVISGGWWAKTTHREYHFMELSTGQIFWVYHDRERRAWFLHGEIE